MLRLARRLCVSRVPLARNFARFNRVRGLLDARVYAQPFPWLNSRGFCTSLSSDELVAEWSDSEMDDAIKSLGNLDGIEALGSMEDIQSIAQSSLEDMERHAVARARRGTFRDNPLVVEQREQALAKLLAITNPRQVVWIMYHLGKFHHTLSKDRIGPYAPVEESDAVEGGSELDVVVSKDFEHSLFAHKINLLDTILTNVFSSSSKRRKGKQDKRNEDCDGSGMAGIDPSVHPIVKEYASRALFGSSDGEGLFNDKTLLLETGDGDNRAQNEAPAGAEEMETSVAGESLSYVSNADLKQRLCKTIVETLFPIAEYISPAHLHRARAKHPDFALGSFTGAVFEPERVVEDPQYLFEPLVLADNFSNPELEAARISGYPVLVRNISPNITVRELGLSFRHFGPVKSVELFRGSLHRMIYNKMLAIHRTVSQRVAREGVRALQSEVSGTKELVMISQYIAKYLLKGLRDRDGDNPETTLPCFRQDADGGWSFDPFLQVQDPERAAADIDWGVVSADDGRQHKDPGAEWSDIENITPFANLRSVKNYNEVLESIFTMCAYRDIYDQVNELAIDAPQVREGLVDAGDIDLEAERDALMLGRQLEPPGKKGRKESVVNGLVYFDDQESQSRALAPIGKLFGVSFDSHCMPTVDVADVCTMRVMNISSEWVNELCQLAQTRTRYKQSILAEDSERKQSLGQVRMYQNEFYRDEAFLKPVKEWTVGQMRQVVLQGFMERFYSLLEGDIPLSLISLIECERVLPSPVIRIVCENHAALSFCMNKLASVEDFTATAEWHEDTLDNWLAQSIKKYSNAEKRIGVGRNSLRFEVIPYSFGDFQVKPDYDPFMPQF